MNYNFKKITVFFIIIFFFGNMQLFSFSASIKTAQDYRFTLSILRKVKIMVNNFPNEKRKLDYAKIKKNFENASKIYFGRKYAESFEKFQTIKLDLMALLEEISKDYLARTKKILDSTSTQSFNILIDFGKNSGLAVYFKRPFNPLKDVKPYRDAKGLEKYNYKKDETKNTDGRKYSSADYHFFRDKVKIEHYLSDGYKKYNFAKNFFEDPDIALYKDRIKKKKGRSSTYNFIIQRYLNVITLCREAKQYGLEIHKILNIYQTGVILRKYKITGKQMSPIYDERIPQEFRVDAADNINLIYSVEKKRIEVLNKNK